MKNEVKDAELLCADTKEALASATDLEAEELLAIHETTFFNGESVRIDVEIRAAKLLVTYKLRWCAYSMLNLVEMTARSRVASRVSTRSVLRN